MIRIFSSALAASALVACGVAENPYQSPYSSPYYVPPGDSAAGDSAGGDPGVPPGDCGNGAMDPGEDCDLALTLTATCQSLGFATGTLRCSATCTYDTSSCQALETCNNGQLDTLEACEGYELRGETCDSQGFTDGTLRCSSACVLDTSECTLCGNNVLETGELCDGIQFDGKTCQTEVGSGFVGELSCESVCSYISTSGCSEAASRDEQCYDGLACLPEYSCDMVYADPEIATCKLQCPNTAIGTSGGCPGGELCFASGWIEPQGGSAVSCIGPSDCDPGYECLGTNQGDICGRIIAWCGTPVEWASDYSSTDALANAPTCNAIFGHAMCRTPMTSSSTPATPLCVPLAETGDGACVALCEGNSSDLDCGSGQYCAVPADNFYFMSQREGDAEIPCSDDTPCDTTAGYRCVQLANQVCARPAKVCLPI